MKPKPEYDFNPHPIATLFPMIPADELILMAESIKKNGQRDPIVRIDNLILDGRNRLAACELAGVIPTFREFGSVITDGASPAEFVTDKNLRNRHLEKSIRIAIAEEMVPYFEESGLTTTEARTAAAEKLNVSTKSVQRAATLKEKAPEKFEEVKAGKTTLNAAVNSTKEEAAKKKEELQRLEDTAAEQKLADARKQFAKTVTKNCGETFGQAFSRGTILKKEADFDAFVTLPKEEMQLLQDLIVKGWSVDRASKFMHSTLTEKNTLEDLINFAIGEQREKILKIKILGHVITCRKQQEGETI